MNTKDSETRARMTDAQLAEIEARVDAATPGPWTRKADRRAHFVGALDYLDTPSQVISASTYPGQEGMVFCSAENSAFIIHAREDVPALLAEVRRLARDLAHLRAAYEVRSKRRKRLRPRW